LKWLTEISNEPNQFGLTETEPAAAIEQSHQMPFGKEDDSDKMM
jgi:hypothetical protein